MSYCSCGSSGALATHGGVQRKCGGEGVVIGKPGIIPQLQTNKRKPADLEISIHKLLDDTCL